MREKPAATAPAPTSLTRRQLGFVGLGFQGTQIARRYLENGELLVYDLRAQAMERLAKEGALLADDVAALGRRCNLIGICVVNDDQLATVALGSEGLLENTSAGSILVIHATVSPDLVLDLASAASRRGVLIVDAPVSGGKVAGQPMTFMVGGDPDAIAQCLPLLGSVGENVTLTGTTGTAAAAKLAHQIILCGNLLAAKEGMEFAQTYGIPADVIKQITRLGTAQSKVVDRWLGPVVPSDTAKLLVKDLDLCLALSADRSLALPGARLARTHLEPHAQE